MTEEQESSVYNYTVDVDLSEVIEKMDSMQESIDSMKETIETMQESEAAYVETITANSDLMVQNTESITNNVFLVAVLLSVFGGVVCGLLLCLHFKR